MRLIKTDDLTLIEVPGDYSGRYAILSHTWEDGEVSHQEMQTAIRYRDPEAETVMKKPGYSKIRNFAKVAAQDGFLYIWVDTCCIDKTSSAELSEAINSMYRWYKNATRCYVYLADVPPGPYPDGQDAHGSSTDHPLDRTRWTTRGWTLQELIAPQDVVFYYSDLTYAFSKLTVLKTLARVTEIPEGVLRTGDCSSVSVAGRMRWAANRTTTRIEDMAYCLLGIFNINMPLLYGEAEGAFLRLQEEICRASDDQTIFAWQQQVQSSSPEQAKKEAATYRGLFARSPKEFAANPEWFEPVEHSQFVPPFGSTSIGFNAQFTLIPLTGIPELLVTSIHPSITVTGQNVENEYLAILNIKACVPADRYTPFQQLERQRQGSNHGLAILVKALSPGATTRQFARVKPSTIYRFGLAQARVSGLLPADPESLYVRHRIRIPENHASARWGGLVIEKGADWSPQNRIWLVESKEYQDFKDVFPVPRSCSGRGALAGTVFGVIDGHYPGRFVIYFGSGPTSDDGTPGPPAFWLQRGEITEPLEDVASFEELVRPIRGFTVGAELGNIPWTILGFRTGAVNVKLGWHPKLMDDMLVCALTLEVRIDS